jgi:hypothetical protein
LVLHRFLPMLAASIAAARDYRTGERSPALLIKWRYYVNER